MKNPIFRLWIARLLIGAVLAMNVQSALAFLFAPTKYAPAYELNGAVGAAAIQGFGVLFLMWNVPYGVAAWHPGKYRLVLIICIIMQAIGLVGESFILWGLPIENLVLRGSILRFVIFDGYGFVGLVLAAGLARDINPEIKA
jgi:hypothetical protein